MHILPFSPVMEHSFRFLNNFAKSSFTSCNNISASTTDAQPAFNPFAVLSIDEYLSIFGFLSPKELCAVMECCTAFCGVSKDKSLWAYCKFEEETTAKNMALYQRAANAGNAQAQFKLGVLYHFGEEITEDFQRALYWYMKAAEKGDRKAQYNIGCMFDKGQGVEQNFIQANDWFLKAALHGNPHAQNALGINHEKGDGVTVDLPKALEWYHQAAFQGLCDAQFNLGVFYSRPEEGVRNLVLSHVWYTVAANNHDQDAAEHRDKLVSLMTQQQTVDSAKLVQELSTRIKPRA